MEARNENAELSKSWSEHWLSRLLDISQITFIPVDAGANEYRKKNIANEIYPHTKEELCTVVYNKRGGCCTILDVFFPSLGEIPVSFQMRRPPDLAFGDFFCGEDEPDMIDVEINEQYRTEFRKHLSSRYWSSVDFGVENVSKTCSVRVFCPENWDKLCKDVDEMEYPTAQNPEMVSIVRNRLWLLDYLKTCLNPDALKILQNGSNTCICSNTSNLELRASFQDFPGKVSVVESGLKGIVRDRESRGSTCDNLSECVKFRCSELYRQIKDRRIFSQDLFTENGRKEDFFGFYWVLMLSMYDRNLWEKVKIYEPIFCFLKLQIYARTESDLVEMCQFNAMNLIPIERSKKINKQFSRVEHKLFEYRQIPENIFQTHFRVYESCLWWNVGILAEEYPGILLISYPLLSVYLSLLNRQLIQETLSKFYRNSLSRSISGVLSGLRSTGYNFVSPSPEQIGEVLTEEARYRSSKLDCLYPNFERNVIEILQVPGDNSKKNQIKILDKSHPRGFHQRTTQNFDIPEDILRLLKLKRGDIEEKDASFSRFQEGTSSIASDGQTPIVSAPRPEIGQYCDAISQNIELMFPPCVTELFVAIDRERRHPKNDERYLIMSFLYDLGFDALQITSVYKELFIDNGLNKLDVKEFLNSGQYGVGLVDGLKRLAKRASENGGPSASRVSWSCASMYARGMCRFSDQTSQIDIEDLDMEKMHNHGKIAAAGQSCGHALADKLQKLHPFSPEKELYQSQTCDTSRIFHPIEYVSRVQDYFY